MGVEPYLLYFGLLCGATLGGNLTPVGASANITATGLLRKHGCGEVIWRMPEETGFYQPIVIARK